MRLPFTALLACVIAGPSLAGPTGTWMTDSDKSHVAAAIVISRSMDSQHFPGGTWPAVPRLMNGFALRHRGAGVPAEREAMRGWTGQRGAATVQTAPAVSGRDRGGRAVAGPGRAETPATPETRRRRC